MKKSITVPSILQSVLTPEEVALVVQTIGYEHRARKFTVYHLLQYWCVAASEEWPSYRFGADHAVRCGLPQVHYSCFSGKSADVPFAIFKELFQCLFVNVIGKLGENLLSPKNCY